MDPVSRRSFLVRGGAGVAGATLATSGASAVLSSPAGAAPLSREELAVLDQPVLVQVRDAAKGEVELLVGDRSVTFVDKSLVASVLRATH